MRDIDFPSRGVGYLDLDENSSSTSGGSNPVALGPIDIYEKRLAAAQASRRRDPSVARIRQILRELCSGVGARDRGCAPGQHRRVSGIRPCSTCGSNTRFIPISPISPIHPALDAWAFECSPCCVSCRPAESFARLNSRAILGWSGSTRVGARPRCGSSSWVPAYSGWHGPSAVPFMPGDPVPAFSGAGSGGDCVHCGALHYADRLGLQSCAGCAVVSAADRNADRDLHPIYGARKHRRGKHSAASLGDQRSDSAWCTASVFPSSCGETMQFAGSHLLTSLLSFNLGVELGQLLVLLLLIPVLDALFRYRGRGTDGDDHPLRPGGAHSLALDAGSRRSLAAISLPMAGDHRRAARLRDTLADVDRDSRRPDLDVRIFASREAKAESGARVDQPPGNG